MGAEELGRLQAVHRARQAKIHQHEVGMVRQCLGDGVGPGGREPGDGIAQLAQAARQVQGDQALIFHDEEVQAGGHAGLLLGTEPTPTGRLRRARGLTQVSQLLVQRWGRPSGGGRARADARGALPAERQGEELGQERAELLPVNRFGDIAPERLGKLWQAELGGV